MSSTYLARPEQVRVIFLQSPHLVDEGKEVPRVRAPSQDHLWHGGNAPFLSHGHGELTAPSPPWALLTPAAVAEPHFSSPACAGHTQPSSGHPGLATPSCNDACFQAGILERSKLIKSYLEPQHRKQIKLMKGISRQFTSSLLQDPHALSKATFI